MRIKKIAGVVLGTSALLLAYPASPASAVNNIKGFGVRETLKDYYSLSDFSNEIGYTVRDIKPSRDVVGYPVAGRLYEANVTADAIVGTAVPQPVDFIARTAGGVDYRALSNVSTLSGAPIGQGGSTSGKLYFDVVGENPDSVIYNSNFEDLLGWVNPQPVEVVPGTNSGGGQTGADAQGGGAEAPSTSGGNEATPPAVSDGVQNGPYGPAGSTPPVGNS